MPLETQLKNLKTIEDLQNLLIETIGFEETDERVFFPEEKPVLQAEYPQILKLAELFDFSVLVLPVAHQLLKTRQRAAIETLQKRYPFSLYIFVDLSKQLWHWVFPKPDQIAQQKILRRIVIGVDERLHTIIERLTQLSKTLLECENTGEVVAAVDKAFDVEMVSQQFFRAYQQQYENFKQRLKEDNKNKAWVYDENKLSRYVQLLLGRILFLHFLEKKTWLNQNNNFIRELQLPYAKKEQQGFYREVLRPLFFEALNKPGDKTEINGQKYQIPFLNGGLFEARAEFDEADLINCPHFADELFTDLLNMLGQYNFTVDESTPLDQAVGIDPEMLGKVLENLLEAEARHASGTYYTPRSIVAYMCRETLYRHLSISRATFKQLIETASTGDTAPIELQLAKDLNEQLDQLKILDPAVGSGAFLLGMLQEILLLKESLARVEGETIPRATLKRHIIHNSLYAVDISFPAIEIARLRLWLALVVDEAKPEPLPNLDYHIIRGDTLQTLFDGKPVLPVKIENQQNELLPTSNQAHTTKLLQYLDELYVANGAKKSKLRQQIKAQLTAMVEAHWANKEETLNQKLQTIDKRRVKGKLSPKWEKDYKSCFDLLAKITEQRTSLNKSRQAGEELDLPFTPLHLYFADVFSGDNNAFDIVIANPPYVRQEQIKEIKPHLKEEFGKFFRGTADLYTYFYKRGLELLKTGGHLGFIAPNKFMRAGYGKNTRELLTTVATPKVIIDFGDSPVFDATTYPAIVLVEKTIEPVTESPAIDVVIIKTRKEIEQVAEVLADRGFKMPVADLSIDGWTLESKEVLELMKKIRKLGTPLGEYVQGRFYYGIKTGFNDAFVIDAATRDKLIAEDAKSAELIKPWLRGRDIRKWRAEWADLYIINIPSSANKEWLWSKAKTESEARQIFDKVYPAIHAHLSQWEPKLKKRDDQGKFFWELRSCAYYAEFEQPKIIWGNLAKSPKFAFDSGCNYISAPANLIPSEDLYLFAILNSKICEWLIERQAAVRSGNFLEFKPMYVAEIPICSVTTTQKAPIIERVKTILAEPTAPDVPRLEKEIDELVFELYQLTEAERALVTEV